jgi:AcrR family transcriptional regulator
MTRLTRKEQQAQTRATLLEAAARVVTRRGLHGASLEQVAAEAGYTKGAIYANFKSREELFLALLDERLRERSDVLDDELHAPGTPEEHARAGGAEFDEYLRQDSEWERLFFEFAIQAARDETFRAQLLERWEGLLARITGAIDDYAERSGIALPGPTDRFALMIFTMANGVALQRLVDPEGVDEELLSDMLALLTRGALADADLPLTS